MKAQELRIGNLIQYKIVKNTVEVIGIDLETKSVKTHESSAVIDYYFEPVPLTEEWLLKLGIVLHEYKTGVKPIFVTNTLFLVWAGSHLVVSFKDPESKVFIDLGLKRIHYVHQLQNWYAENTGEELTIKETPVEVDTTLKDPIDLVIEQAISKLPDVNSVSYNSVQIPVGDNRIEFLRCYVTHATIEIANWAKPNQNFKEAWIPSMYFSFSIPARSQEDIWKEERLKEYLLKPEPPKETV